MKGVRRSQSRGGVPPLEGTGVQESGARSQERSRRRSASGQNGSFHLVVLNAWRFSLKKKLEELDRLFLTLYKITLEMLNGRDSCLHRESKL